MRKLLSSIGLAVVLSVVVLGAGASSAAADPVADLRAFVEAGFHGTTDAEYRAWAEVLATSTDSPVTSGAATDALAGTDVEVHAFVDGGYLAAWHADERLRLARVLAAATGPAVTAGVQAALASSDPAVWSAFLTTGLAQAQYADDRLMAATMLTGGANNSGPALDAAAQAALAGTPAELREFVLNGQFTARALDAQAAAPAAPAVPPAAAPQPAAVAAPPVAAATTPAATLAVTGASDKAPAAALAATAILVGAGLVLLARRRRLA